jgi:hypothetical protein
MRSVFLSARGATAARQRQGRGPDTEGGDDPSADAGRMVLACAFGPLASATCPLDERGREMFTGVSAGRPAGEPDAAVNRSGGRSSCQGAGCLPGDRARPSDFSTAPPPCPGKDPTAPGPRGNTAADQAGGRSPARKPAATGNRSRDTLPTCPATPVSLPLPSPSRQAPHGDPRPHRHRLRPLEHRPGHRASRKAAERTRLDRCPSGYRSCDPRAGNAAPPSTRRSEPKEIPRGRR